MVDKIEMSLDDIIKTTKTLSVNKRGGAGGARGSRGGFRGAGTRRPVPNRNGGGAVVQKGSRGRGGGIAKPRFARVRR